MSNIINFTVDEKYDGKTIKIFLKDVVKLSIRSVIKLKAKENGITVNGVHARVIDFLSKGDVLSLNLEDSTHALHKIPENLLETVYEDEHLLIVNKPPFMAMYPIGVHKENTVMQSIIMPSCGFKPLYRLDLNTSGLVVLAKNSFVMAHLEVEKTYIAVCEGITPEKGVLDDLMELKEGSIIIREVGHGKRAITHFKRVSHDDAHSLLKVKIKTGRTHQIRVHMSSIGHSLAGDDLYGGGDEFINRHALHCGKLKIKSTFWSGQKVIELLPPEDMQNAFKDLFRRIERGH